MVWLCSKKDEVECCTSKQLVSIHFSCASISVFIFISFISSGDLKESDLQGGALLGGVALLEEVCHCRDGF